MEPQGNFPACLHGMLCLAIPTGAFHGWGVCGRYLARELAALQPVALLTEPFDVTEAGDELDYHLLRSLLMEREPAEQVDAPVLQAVFHPEMLPYRPGLRGRFNLGYTFFENNLLSGRQVANLRAHFDLVAAGSRFCEEMLRGYGLTSVVTVLQGVDPTVFHPVHPEKEYFRDRFVVFSGGKFEFRKGQDLVIRAFQVLQERHRDVLLVTCWHNCWSASLATMQLSRHIRFQPSPDDFTGLVSQVLRDNGIDPERVITLLPRPNVMMARIYRNTDVGLFPNRCEGGTNLVLMEYMACGKPAIASLNSGHRDILTPANSVPIRGGRPLTLREGDRNVAEWMEPDLEETVALLEWAYQHRDQLDGIGLQAGRDMSRLTWKRTAAQFHHLLAAAPAGAASGPSTGPAAGSA
jgi:glycosyltransferase involved in cell wall biosynthesis